MKTDEPRDDEILGRALSRAIETAEVKETPYEGSRIAMHPMKSGGSLWRVAALAASVAIAVALGSTLFDRPARDQSAGQQPTPSVAATPQAASATPGSPSSTAQPDAIDHRRVFIARDGLPPTSQHLDSVLGQCAACLPGMSGVPTTAEDRIGSRLNSLNRAFSGLAATPLNVDLKTAYPASVRINGDTVTVDYYLASGSWPVRGAAASLAWQQQLVYTATEEPGIRRVLFTQNGGKQMRIDQMVLDKPLTREDVSGYPPVKSEALADSVSRACSPTPCPSPTPIRLSNTYSVDSIAPGVSRFIVQVESGTLANFSVKSYEASDDVKTAWNGKYVFRLELSGTEIKPGLEIVDRTPLRAIRSTALDPAVGGGTRYELALDDLRPWRLAVLQNPDRIVVDFGGDPTAISDTVAVYSPKPGDTVRQFTVSGMSRTFEATTSWRVVDAARRVLASGFTQASRGTSPVWGTFQTAIDLSSASGNVTLEVYWASPRDGADTGLVQIPLTVR